MVSVGKTVCLLLFSAFMFLLGSNTSFGREASITIHKHLQLLTLRLPDFSEKKYRVCLGASSLGPKTKVGDRKTPEGVYYVCCKNMDTKYHRFLGVSYPGPADAQAALERGDISRSVYEKVRYSARIREAPPWNTALGGWIGIHGYPDKGFQRLWMPILHPKPDNWTDGCIALWDSEIETVFNAVQIGTPVVILP